MAPTDLYVLDRGDKVFLEKELVEGFAVGVEVWVVSDEVVIEVVRVCGGLVDGEGGRVGARHGGCAGGGEGCGVFVAWEGLVGMRGSVGVDVEEVCRGVGLGGPGTGETGTGGKVARGIGCCWLAGRECGEGVGVGIPHCDGQQYDNRDMK